MTREAFIEELEEEGYSYRIEGDKIVVTHNRSVYLSSLETLPPGVEFMNKGDVYLRSLKTLPPGVVFKNGGGVVLSSLETISPGVEFRNKWDVYLESFLAWFDLRGGFHNWIGNIEGVDSKRLLNKMIEDGIFDRR